jgi:hypothetical protein
VRLDCIGGFVVTMLYGLSRPTADVDARQHNVALCLTSNQTFSLICRSLA